MKLREQLAAKMLEEKLSFLPLKESLELLNSGEELNTHLYWVMNIEEITDNGNGMSIEEILAEFEDIYGLGGNYALRIGRKDDEFDEFTLNLCPAPTYIDLIR